MASFAFADSQHVARLNICQPVVLTSSTAVMFHKEKNKPCDRTHILDTEFETWSLIAKAHLRIEQVPRRMLKDYRTSLQGDLFPEA